MAEGPGATSYLILFLTIIGMVVGLINAPIALLPGSGNNTTNATATPAAAIAPIAPAAVPDRLPGAGSPSVERSGIGTGERPPITVARQPVGTGPADRLSAV